MKYFLELFSAAPLKVKLASGFLLVFAVMLAIMIPAIMLLVLLIAASLISCFIIIDYLMD